MRVISTTESEYYLCELSTSLIYNISKNQIDIDGSVRLYPFLFKYNEEL